MKTWIDLDSREEDRDPSEPFYRRTAAGLNLNLNRYWDIKSYNRNRVLRSKESGKHIKVS